MHVIIPARYDSTRLPGKPLLDIAGKPMIQHVYERAVQSGPTSVAIATDDDRIRRAAEGFGARVIMTSGKHRSGTERLAEAIIKLGIAAEEIVVNLQGDEPMMSPDLLRQAADSLVAHDPAVMATIATPLRHSSDRDNPNVVKVVLDAQGYALYFSRAAIPYLRPSSQSLAGQDLRHIGIYAYRAGFVGQYVAWGPAPPEQAEQLEQLRVLWHGKKIAVAICDPEMAPDVSVDTPADLDRVRRLFTAKRN